MITYETHIGLSAGGGTGYLGRLHQSKDTPGGPGATNTTAKKPSFREADNTFNLTASSTSLKQGETKTVLIGIKRGKNFQDDVTVKFTDMPQGVTLDPASLTIKHGETDTKVTLKAVAERLAW